MPFATILEPLKFDTVKSPVVVIAGYTTTMLFPMSGAVDGNSEMPPQSHGPGSGVHTSAGITASPATHSVHAKSSSAFLDTQSDVKVISGTLPIQVDSITGLASKYPGKAASVIMNRTLNGQCDPSAVPLASDVVCRVYEVNSTSHDRTLIATASALVVTDGTLRIWLLTVAFPMDTTNNNLQYNARVTAYASDGTALGTVTKYLPKT